MRTARFSTWADTAGSRGSRASTTHGDSDCHSYRDRNFDRDRNGHSYHHGYSDRDIDLYSNRYGYSDCYRDGDLYSDCHRHSSTHSNPHTNADGR